MYYRYNDDEPCLACGEVDGECDCTLEIEALDAARHCPGVNALVPTSYTDDLLARSARTSYDLAMVQRALREYGYGR